MKRNCIICGNSLAGRRKDAKTCSDACRTAYKKLKDEGKIDTQTENKVESPSPKVELVEAVQETKFDKDAQLYKDIEQLRGQIAATKNQIQYIEQNYLIPNKKEYDKFNEHYQNLKEEFSEQERMSKFDNLKLYDYYYRGKDKSYYDNFDKLAIIFWSKERINAVNKLRRRIYNKKQEYEEALSVCENHRSFYKAGMDEAKAAIKPLADSMTQDQEHLERLEDYYYNEPRKTQASRFKSIDQEKEKEIFSPSETKGKIFSGLEIAEAQFQPVMSFEGELGKFLGQIDRDKFACALTGNAGAGKSEFSFHFAHLFTHHQFEVIYYSLEMGVNQSVKEKVIHHQLIKNFHIRDSGKLADLHQDAQKFDCVIVDSFGKLDATADDLDNLRNTHPNTFFIFIFQKTNNGTMRGGSKIIYDCTMNIDLQLDKQTNQRKAVMVKSRYGSQGEEYLVPDFQ